MLTNILLQAAPGGSAGYMNLIFIGGMIVVFYFFMIRPQQKRQKDQKTFQESLKVGDAVVTTGGIHGKVVGMEGSTLMIEVDRGVKIKCEKYAVSYEATRGLQQAQETKA